MRPVVWPLLVYSSILCSVACLRQYKVILNPDRLLHKVTQEKPVIFDNIITPPRSQQIQL